MVVQNITHMYNSVEIWKILWAAMRMRSATPPVIIMIQSLANFLEETTEIEQWPDAFQSCSQFTSSTLQLYAVQ